MRRVLISAAFTFWLPMLLLGQEQVPSVQTSAPSVTVSSPINPSSATSPSGGNSHKTVLKDGQAIVMRSSKRLSSETAKVGDTVQFEVIKPVVVDNLVVIPLHGLATERVAVAEKKKRRLRAGKLAITVESVRTVIGQAAPLRATEAHGERAIDYEARIDPGPGAILVAPFIVLISHGPEWVIPTGTRIVAYLNGDLVLDREAVQNAQGSLPKSPTNAGVVYIYRGNDSRDYPNNTIAVACGEALLGLFHPGQFVSLQLPPGEYWLRAGVPARIDTPISKKYLDGKVEHFFRLSVEQGHAYYLHFRETKRRYRLDTIIEHHLEEVDQSIGADAVLAAQSWADLGLTEIPQETLGHLQAQPTNRTRSEN